MIKIIPERLKYARNNKGLTQKKVAEYLEITETSYQLYEYGKRTPALKMFAKICEYLGVSSDYLLGINPELSLEYEYVLLERLTETDGLGNALKEKRLEEKLSPEEFSDKVELSTKNLHDIESDEYDLTPETLSFILETLNTDVFKFASAYDLYGEYIPPFLNGDIKAHMELTRFRYWNDDYPASINEMIEKFNDLNPANQLEVENFIDFKVYQQRKKNKNEAGQ